MDFRSHLGRPMDFRRPSNLIIGVVTLVTAGIALVIWLNGASADILLAPVYVFVIWGLLREIDPDHDWAAFASATVVALWELLGMPSASALAIAGLMLAARISTSTTGRRPLPIDLGFVAIFGIGIGFSVAGWVASFGIAVAIYLDERFNGTNRLMAIGAAALTAIGTTVVATVTGAFPDRNPDVIQYLAVGAGVAALLLLVREPAAPVSQVDARHAAFIDKARLHVSRSLVGILVFFMAILTGADGDALLIVVIALVIAVVSNEIELLRRRR